MPCNTKAPSSSGTELHSTARASACQSASIASSKVLPNASEWPSFAYATETLCGLSARLESSRARRAASTAASLRPRTLDTIDSVVSAAASPSKLPSVWNSWAARVLTECAERRWHKPSSHCARHASARACIDRSPALSAASRTGSTSDFPSAGSSWQFAKASCSSSEDVIRELRATGRTWEAANSAGSARTGRHRARRDAARTIQARTMSRGHRR